MNINMQLRSAASTRAGGRHEENQDAVYHLTQAHPAGSDVGLYIVCDGMGGHEAGEEASKLALKSAVDALAEPLLVQAPRNGEVVWHKLVYEAVQAANKAVWEASQERANKMGSTIVLAAVTDGIAYVGSVGDSRAYGCRDGQATRITRDHSMAAALADINEIAEEEVATHPRNNLLWRALGQEATVDVDLFRWMLQDGDRLLLCSDGLWKALPDPAELGAALNAPSPPEEIAQQLVRGAIERDGSDDASAVVVQVRALGVAGAAVQQVEVALEQEQMAAVPA